MEKNAPVVWRYRHTGAAAHFRGRAAWPPGRDRYMIWQRQIMALHYDLRTGIRQAQLANRYLRSVAAEKTDALLPEMNSMQYLVKDPSNRDLSLRLWTFPGTKDPLDDLLPWLIKVKRTVDEFDYDVPAWLPGILACEGTDLTCFVEVLENHKAFTKDEKSMLSVGLQAGRTVLLSSPRSILVELEPGLIGMAVHYVGSWLINSQGSSQSSGGTSGGMGGQGGKSSQGGSKANNPGNFANDPERASEAGQ